MERVGNVTQGKGCLVGATPQGCDLDLKLPQNKLPHSGPEKVAVARTEHSLSHLAPLIPSLLRREVLKKQ